jgi:twitching motility protein PilT
MARIDSFLRLVVEQNASDLHMRAGHVPVIRHCGDLHALPFRTLSQEEASRLIEEIMPPEQQQRLRKAQEIDFAYNLEGIGRFRGHVFLHSGGIGAVFRAIPSKVPTIEELLLPPILKALSAETKGLILVTGPTGSGKSTTMAAMVREINESSSRHIITLEDPIEFVHEPIRSLVTQRQVGQHAESFASGVRSALREAPDVLVVGELRDLETMSLALTAAETGVLVIGTLHTRSTVRAIDRIVDTFADDARDQARTTLSVALKAVIAQHLCRSASGEALLPAIEVLLQNYAVAHLIRDNKLHQLEGFLENQDHRGSGMQSMDSCIISLFAQGAITQEEALRGVSSPEVLQRAILSPVSL